jgi:GT2 family glycosyltransferase/uncharacterized coiled-coil protein SlyX
MPFAAWVTSQLKPGIFVELGTHTGNSYFSFCQAVSENDLETKCYAVDTWVGEEHSGYYGDEVYHQVSEHNQKHYAGFSRLLRMTFDEALDGFADASVDLLHIDGLHTYDAVRHDFESWLPKLAPGAVVLLHDVNVRERGFGVWRLWEELKKRYPGHFEFIHSQGLGVLQLEGGPDDKKLGWLAASPATGKKIRDFFSTLGARQLERFELGQLQKNLAGLKQVMTEKDGHIESFRATVAEKDGHIQSLQATVTEKDGHIQSLQATMAEKDRHIQSLQTTVTEKDRHIASLQATVTEKDGHIQSLQATVAEKDGHIESLQATVAEKDGHIESFQATVTEKDRHIQSFQVTVAEKDGHIQSLQDTVAEKEARLLDLQESAAHQEEQIAALSHSLSEKEALVGELSQAVAEKDGHIHHLNHIVAQKDDQLTAIINSTSWRLTGPLRSAKESTRSVARRTVSSMATPLVERLEERPQLKSRLVRVLERTPLAGRLRRYYQPLKQPVSQAPVLHEESKFSFAGWLDEFDTPTSEERAELEKTTDSSPRILLLAIFDENSAHLAGETARRLQENIGVRWQALFFFSDNRQGGDNTAGIAPELDTDPRIFIDQIPPAVEADLLVVLCDGALPRSHALRTFAEGLRKTPHARMLYADDAGLAPGGEPQDPWFKPCFSPLLVKQGMLPGALVAIRPDEGELTTLVDAFAAPRAEPQAILADLALQAGDTQVQRIPHILYYRTTPLRPQPLDPPALEAPLPDVSIIIPTRDRWDLLGPCLQSMRATQWPADNFEIIIVDNGSTDRLTLEKLSVAQAAGEVRIIRDDAQFNWSRLNNRAVREARGELLIFLNNDTEIIDPDWVKKLAAYALQPQVGVVGCKLLYPDRTVQHGGVVTGIQGLAGHAHLFLKAHEGGYCGLANITREITAVTGACLAVSRRNYELAGGFDEQLRVAFNDTSLCLALHSAGKRNIYVADALIVHHESKSRGYDDTPEKRALLLSEAMLVWQRFPQLLREDPFYSPNLCLSAPYRISFAPRRPRLWVDRSARPARIMLLSVTHGIGHGVPVVLAEQAELLRQSGYEVIVGGPRSDHDHSYRGCERVEVQDPQEAARIACQMSVDVIVAHTPPFYSVAKWTGNGSHVIAYDHGEPPARLFPDAAARAMVQTEKDFSLVMANRVIAISKSIEAESSVPIHAVVRNGNSHLGRWSEAFAERRSEIREARGWQDAFIVLNVCRFHEAERAYKGVDLFADVKIALKALAPELHQRTVFVLCGKGAQQDVQAMTRRGLQVEANVTDEEMLDLYCAADAYASFSQWEGYNLGIGQALAMGLPVVASAIPAHREFEVPVTDDPVQAAARLAAVAGQPREREPRVWDWREQLKPFMSIVEELCPAAQEFEMRHVRSKRQTEPPKSQPG